MGTSTVVQHSRALLRVLTKPDNDGSTEFMERAFADIHIISFFFRCFIIPSVIIFCYHNWSRDLGDHRKFQVARRCEGAWKHTYAWCLSMLCEFYMIAYVCVASGSDLVFGLHSRGSHSILLIAGAGEGFHFVILMARNTLGLRFF